VPITERIGRERECRAGIGQVHDDFVFLAREYAERRAPIFIVEVTES